MIMNNKERDKILESQIVAELTQAKLGPPIMGSEGIIDMPIRAVYFSETEINHLLWHLRTTQIKQT
jgi:hypothetical protein